jgi:two-component system NtrC family sensor kinase
MDKTQHRYERLRRLILAIMIVVPFIPFILVLGIGYYYFTTSLETNTIAGMERIVEDHRQMIESFLKERKSELEFIIQSYHFEELADPEKLFRVYKQLKKESPAFIDLGIFNEEGIHVTYFGPYKLVGRDYGQEGWFREVLRKGVYISDIFLGYRKIPHFIIAVAREEEGKKWVIRATIDTYVFTDLVEKVRIGKTGEAYILNGEGLFQTQRRSGGNLMERDPDRIVAPGPYEGIKTFVRNHLAQGQGLDARCKTGKRRCFQGAAFCGVYHRFDQRSRRGRHRFCSLLYDRPDHQEDGAYRHGKRSAGQAAGKGHTPCRDRPDGKRFRP